MNVPAELRGFWQRYRILRNRYLRIDVCGFGFSRTDIKTEPVVIPDDVDLYFFTGRTRREDPR